MSHGRSSRLRDFEARRSGDDVIPFLGTEYLTVHPFADDLALLARLSWPSSSCTSVDAYWLACGDVVFVEIVSADRDVHRAVGRYIRRNPASGYVNLVAVVAVKEITRAVFEGELRAFLEQGTVADALKRRSRLGPDLVAVRGTV